MLTVQEYKDYKAILETDEQAFNDSQAQLLINAASQSIENFCGRKFITPAEAIDEIFDGDGEVGVLDFLELLAAWGACP